MSPSRPWFRLGPALEDFEPDAAGKLWLQDTATRVLAVLGASNVYTEASQMFQDVATFGTSPMIVYEDHDDVIRCYLPCAGEYFLDVGGRLMVDTIYREYTYTVLQIIDWFKLENCPSEIRQKWTEGGASLQMEFVIAHAIEPNFPIDDRRGGAIHVVSSQFAFREVYWLRGMQSQTPLSVRGF